MYLNHFASRFHLAASGSSFESMIDGTCFDAGSFCGVLCIWLERGGRFTFAAAKVSAELIDVFSIK